MNVPFPPPHSLFTVFLVAACATVQDPPGGPPDLAPPVLVSIAPDSGSALTDLGQAAVIQFNEVIAERPGVALDQLIVVSPRASQLSVAWKRDAIEVKPRGGWRPGVPYQLTLLPGITDLRNNKLNAGRSVVFSTGGGIPATRATGRAVDWEAGGAAVRALVELTRTSDSLAYWGLADSTGAFAIAHVPPGPYVLSATVDKNNNRQRDYREPFDSALITLDSTLDVVLWAFTHDSVGPRLRTAQRADSNGIRLEFTQPLAPGGPAAGAIRVRLLPDSTPVTIESISSVTAHDSSRAQRPTTDTAAAARRPPTIGVAPGRPAVTAGRASAPTAGDSALAKLLATRPKLSATWVVTLSEPLRAGARYVINAVVPNAAGAVGESSTVFLVPTPPARRDTTRADTTRVRP